ncbi:MAG TPA: OsmC family peroxiredoxin [candidate division Zixibacteria bacterium]|nr:OsmC family peroxiredoxin [candidate division Zixibacteria bacterium]HEQ97837.1 OsmC family peroxiredoxin [candidate division Zixibacteria bacterium]
MKVKIRQIDGIALAAAGDTNHWVTMDGPEDFGGHSAGSRPMELLLMSLGSCTAMDVLSILQKKRVKLDDFQMEVESERAEEHPKVFTEIKLHFIFVGKGIRQKDVERAIELSTDKYCPATAMLKKSVKITNDYKIIEG